MINKDNRNSRDDKSSSGTRRPSDRNAPRARTAKTGDRDNDSEGRPDYKKRRPEGNDKREFSRDREDRPYRPKPDGERGGKFEKREFKPRDSGKYPDRERKDFDPKKPRTSSYGDKSFGRGDKGRGFKKDDGQGFRQRPNDKGTDGDYKPKYTKKEWDDFKPSAGSSRNVAPRKREDGDTRPFRDRDENKRFEKKRASSTVLAPAKKTNADKGLIRLNRYISNAGICSRRKADDFIAAGVVSVNGEVVTELGHKVDPTKDNVRYNGELLKREKKVYILLNKPKDYITTTDDPQERKTVMQLIDKATNERVYPVGRLDRNTTGLLLMTNDGDLADKLSHPKNGISKMYNVELDKSLSQGDLNKIAFGLELEDGLIKPDAISYVAGGTKKEIGIQIHSGKNRIVRRIFEHLGYEVEKLDRVVYGNLTKKDLPRGRWRYLEDHELVQIKHLMK